MTRTATAPTTPPRMRRVWRTLEAALDTDDPRVVDAARRLIAADRLGWRRHAHPADVELVAAFDPHHHR